MCSCARSESGLAYDALSRIDGAQGIPVCFAFARKMGRSIKWFRIPSTALCPVDHVFVVLVAQMGGWLDLPDLKFLRAG
jgi:hypothetical protein